MIHPFTHRRAGRRDASRGERPQAAAQKSPAAPAFQATTSAGRTAAGAVMAARSWGHQALEYFNYALIDLANTAGNASATRSPAVAGLHPCGERRPADVPRWLRGALAAIK
jgi:hypothetical protein